jgi:hypothetical protein
VTYPQQQPGQSPQPPAAPAHPPYPAAPPERGHPMPAPPYGGLPAYGAGGHRPPKAGTNGFAVASLVLGAVGALLFSVVFGIIALVQTRRTGQAGRGLAIAGLAVSGVWVLVGVGVVIALIAGAADRDGSGDITAGGDVSVMSLRVGDCLNGLREGQNISDLPGVPCAEPHEGEVFAVFDLPAGAYPGDAKIAGDAERECSDRFEAYAPSSVDDTAIELFFLHPTRLSWAQGDHEVTCVATDPTRKRTGSIKG